MSMCLAPIALSKHKYDLKNIGQMACIGALQKVSTKSVDNSVDKLADSRCFMGLEVQWLISAHPLYFCIVVIYQVVMLVA